MNTKKNKNSFFEYGIANNQSVYSMNHVPITGKVPEWLKGSYIRNGPGMFQMKERRLNHWFDAMGALHKFDITNGKVNYQCSYIECNSYRSVHENGDIAFSEFATDPCKTIFKRFQSYILPSLPKMTDNPKVNVARIANKYMALGETPMQIEFDLETLKTIGVSEPVPGGFAYKTTAHPHIENAHAYNLVVKFGMQSHYKFYDVTKPGRKALSSLSVAKPAYLHGFGMTKKYFIIAAGPLNVIPIELLFWRKSYIENHKWRPEEGASIYVIDKETGSLKVKYVTDPFFCFHHINAWDEGDDIVMDLNGYDDASIIDKYYLKELEKPDVVLPFGTARRFRMNITSRKISCEKISEACIELPRIHYDRFNTDGNYRFTYGISLHPSRREGFYNSLIRIDMRNGQSIYWHEDGCFPGEPFFQPAPNSKNDENGILISIVLDSKNENSFLLILDASNLQEIARATLPEPVVYGFHGEFFNK